jgi:hypothetical protein
MSAITNIFTGWARLTAGIAAALGFAALTSASAQAATYTVGSPLTVPFTSTNSASVATVINSSLAEPGAHVTSPVTGTIVRWRITQAVGGPFKLRVLTPDSGGSYTGAGTSAGEIPASTNTQTFTTSLPIRAGQVIGLDSASDTDNIGVDDETGSAFSGWVPPLADGATAPPTATVPNEELGFNADVVAQPGVSSIAPSSGPGLGGTSMTITGHDLSGATAVSFGGVPARSFTVNSDTSITAVSPAGHAGAVDVTVTTPGGQSPVSAADRFTFVPAIGSISPTHGPRTGGTKVRITGRAFTGATAVRFGSAAARRFTVNSDTNITAVAPATRVGRVNITVTSPSGKSSASASDRFRFNQVCVVPKLKGKKLKAAKKTLKRANCRLGKVVPKGQTTGTVKHQSRKIGKVLPAGSKVNINL